MGIGTVWKTISAAGNRGARRAYPRGLFAVVAAAALAAALPAQARSLLYYYDFDKVENGALVYSHVNNGTGTAEPVFKQNDSATLGFTDGAFGSGHAFCISNKSSLWLGDGSASLGCGTTKGFTISFWCKLTSSHDQFTDFFGFRVGGKCYRFEYTSDSTTQFTIFCVDNSLKNPETGDNLVYGDAAADAWHHFAVVATPNGTRPVGTCALYVDGAKVGSVSLEAAGDLQQLNMGHWVRNGDGTDRNSGTKNANGTGIDELAVFDYPATSEQVKWLAKFKPGQPADGPGRAMPIAYLFDSLGSSGGVQAVNSGSGTDAAYKWVGGYANFVAGAFGSSYAFDFSTASTTYRVDGASAAKGLGAGLDSGMTLSFWIKAPASTTAWRDFLSFRIGGSLYERFEWINTARGFAVYGPSKANGNVSTLANTWQNVCMTWNPATSKMDFYLDGERTAMTLAIANPSSADVLKSLTFGPKAFNETGGNRDGGTAPGVALDEIAVFNHSFSPEQIKWLKDNVPALPPLDATNLVRTISASGAWSGGRAAWGVKEWDADGGTWTDTTRTAIYPALEDTEVETDVTIADGVELTNDTFVTPKKLVLKAAGGAASAALKSADGSMFAPQALEIGAGLRLTVPLYAVNAGGALTLGAGAKIVFDTSNIGVGGTTDALTAGSFVLPAGETDADILSHFEVTDGRFSLSLSADGKTVLVAADTIPVTAVWTGAGDGTSLDSAANWDCRNASGASIEALPVEETRVTICSGTAAANVPAGTTIPWSYRSIEAGSATLAADIDLRGIPALSIPEGVTIDLGGNKLYLNETVAGSGTFTDTAATGGELHFDVAQGATFKNVYTATAADPAAFAFAGTLKLVKDGPGTFVAARVAQTYSGGTVVAAGVLKFGHQLYSGILGARSGDVAVSGDGVLDMNGQVTSYEHRIILNGGTLCNTGADVGSGYAQFANIRLGADSSVSVQRSMGIINTGYAATELDLGGNTLTLNVASGKAFHLCNTTIKNGTVDFASGGWFETGTSKASGGSNNAITATDVDFRVNAAMTLYANIKARNYEALFGVDYNEQSGIIEVNGAFKPSAHNYFRGCKMMDGSTLDLSLRTSALPLVSAFGKGAKTLSFAANAKIKVRLGSADGTLGANVRELARNGGYVVTWLSKPAGIDAVSFDFADGEAAAQYYEFKVDNGGLKVVAKPGFIIHISESKEIEIPGAWVVEKMGDSFGAADVDGWLAGKGANGLPRWQSWLLGLEPADASSVVLCRAVETQPGDGTFAVGANIDVQGGSGADVTAFLDKSSDGERWTQVGEGRTVASGPVSFAATLADGESRCFFRIRVAVR